MQKMYDIITSGKVLFSSSLKAFSYNKILTAFVFAGDDSVLVHEKSRVDV